MFMRIICLIAGFACGSIPTGYIIGKANGVDLRKTGSGNIGSTNVLRTLGRGYGALTMVLDIMKAVIPIAVMLTVYGADTSVRYIVTMYTGVGAAMGHDFSPFMGFKGGKGIATSGGLILMSDPLLFAIEFVTIFAVTIVTGFVSLGSLIASVIYFLFNLAVVVAGFTPGWGFYPQYFDRAYAPEVLVLALILSCTAVYRHKANIRRLISGTENKVSLAGRKKASS